MRLNQLTPEDFELTPGESRPDSLFHFSTRQQFLFLGWKVYLSSIPQSLDRREGVDSALRSWNQRLHQSEPAVDIGAILSKKIVNEGVILLRTAREYLDGTPSRSLHRDIPKQRFLLGTATPGFRPPGDVPRWHVSPPHPEVRRRVRDEAHAEARPTARQL